jgi:hypothetical protein
MVLNYKWHGISHQNKSYMTFECKSYKSSTIYKYTTTKPTHKINIKEVGILEIDMHIVIQNFRV